LDVPCRFPAQDPGAVADSLDVPVSTFSRGSERLCCEIHHERSGFVLVISSPRGGSITQRFADATTLAGRQLALERTLLAAGWVSERGPSRRAPTSFP